MRKIIEIETEGDGLIKATMENEAWFNIAQEIEIKMPSNLMCNGVWKDTVIFDGREPHNNARIIIDTQGLLQFLFTLRGFVAENPHGWFDRHDLELYENLKAIFGLAPQKVDKPKK